MNEVYIHWASLPVLEVIGNIDEEEANDPDELDSFYDFVVDKMVEAPSFFAFL
jgi:hypothetical protein